ncbi:hypothetical protein TRAPUB_5132 [Trametes pubescens]|uniref:Uncharacterized protein n=1 Tax=Trametes pubescens TaxID=154538 RepID=A0A1M2V941_TRAPU|nr:hypothetical protein TRAPUB_5132 [Trametes pubescens]
MLIDQDLAVDATKQQTNRGFEVTAGTTSFVVTHVLTNEALCSEVCHLYLHGLESFESRGLRGVREGGALDFYNLYAPLPLSSHDTLLGPDAIRSLKIAREWLKRVRV